MTAYDLDRSLIIGDYCLAVVASLRQHGMTASEAISLVNRMIDTVESAHELGEKPHEAAIAVVHQEIRQLNRLLR